MAEEVAFFELEDLGVQEVDVRAADCGAGYADDNVLGIDDGGFGDFDCGRC